MIENNLKSKNKLQKHRVSYHWFFCLLYSLSVTAALYRHGHPVFSITVIFLCFPATLSKYLPQKILSKDNREMLLYIFIVAGLAWGMIRAEAGFVSPDIMLIESVALLGIGFFFNCKHHDYALMMLISGILLSYATLFPNVIVLNLFPPIFILTLFILYSSRLMSFAPLKPEESQKIFARINWKFFLIHFLLSSIVTVYFFSLFPIYPQDTKGFIPVHFKTHSDDITPEKFRRWSETSKKTPGLRGEKKENMPILGIGKSKEIISRGDSEGETVLGLSGAGRTGKELLFRVQSPVTLYWLTNLYDSYNGKIWTKSDKLKNKKKFRKLSYKKKVVQTFLIEKWSGRSLPAAFYNFFTTQVSLTPKYHIKREKLNYLLAKDKEYPQTPFKYSASSVLNVYNGKDFRILKIPLKHYIRLPENK
ncbi:MAG: hypothetical protein U9O87_00800, partial [Verrucomicrobiota bacterium]|nr:hypothetical protein [Verrucomicrobiota bacterium]